jgi:PAS domain S-box-containing protein
MLLTSMCLVLSILGYGYHIAREEAQAARSTVTAQIQALAHNLATVDTHFLITDEPHQIEVLTLQTATVPGIYSVLVTDIAGVPISEVVNNNGVWSPRYGLDRVQTPSPQSPNDVLEINQAKSINNDFLSGTGGTMSAWRRIGNSQALGWVRINYRMDKFDELTSEIRSKALKTVALAISVTLFLLWLLLHPAMRALRQATHFASQLDQSQGAKLKVSHRATEIQLLGNALNVVSQRLLIQNVDLHNQKFALDQHAIVSITNLQGTITYANQRFCDISGYSREELLGQNHRIVKSDEHPPQVFEELWRTICRGDVWHGDIKNRKKDGVFYWVNATIVPLLDVNGLPHQFIGIRTDITVNKNLERSLQIAKEQAETAATTKGQFLANMSHEIRTPMNAVLGMLHLLKNTAMDKRQCDYTNKAQSAAQSLMGLLNDILDFSKIEVGKMTLEKRTFSLEKLMSDLSVILSTTVGNKPVKILFDLAPNVPLFLIGDALRLQQVLINLCGNAIKFTAQGEVKLSIQIVAPPPPDGTTVSLHFAVQDSGIGIAPENQTHIFDGFSQAEASTTRRFGGTGLGLSICRQLIALMGGELKLQSTLGLGSTFWFDITLGTDADDRQVPKRSTENASTSAPQPLRGVNLLVVEDNIINQQVAKELLCSQGALVTLADNGQLGVEAVTQAVKEGTPFDLVLMDIQMPVMDGYSATRVLREDLGLTDLPIIAMTANAMASDRDACLAAGMNEHVGKPFNLAQLVELIKHVVPRVIGPHGALGYSDTATHMALLTVQAELDTTSALERLGGSQSLYQRVLLSLLQDMAHLPEQLDRCLASADLTGAARLLHTLKGLSATVGANPLSAAARKAELSVKNANGEMQRLDTHAITTELGAALDSAQRVMQQVAQSFAPAQPFKVCTAAHTNSLTPAELSLISDLQTLLNTYNMRAIDVYEQWQRTFSPADSVEVKQLRQAINAFDFDKAAQSCQQLLEQANPTS